MEHQTKKDKKIPEPGNVWQIIVLEAAMIVAAGGAIAFVVFVMFRFMQLLFVPVD
ncbi:MAG: hypothetical protein GYA24_19465 [Candidatus Lokiarchaeota archaeon]|nr:hypothetical protein [Candidatus Lokiarchaeota archaeon]